MLRTPEERILPEWLAEEQPLSPAIRRLGEG
jgi:hypothetical protein